MSWSSVHPIRPSADRDATSRPLRPADGRDFGPSSADTFASHWSAGDRAGAELLEAAARTRLAPLDRSRAVTVRREPIPTTVVQETRAAPRDVSPRPARNRGRATLILFGSLLAAFAFGVSSSRSPPGAGQPRSGVAPARVSQDRAPVAPGHSDASATRTAAAAMPLPAGPAGGPDVEAGQDRDRTDGGVEMPTASLQPWASERDRPASALSDGAGASDGLPEQATPQAPTLPAPVEQGPRIAPAPGTVLHASGPSAPPPAEPIARLAEKRGPAPATSQDAAPTPPVEVAQAAAPPAGAEAEAAPREPAATPSPPVVPARFVEAEMAARLARTAGDGTDRPLAWPTRGVLAQASGAFSVPSGVGIIQGVQTEPAERSAPAALVSPVSFPSRQPVPAALSPEPSDPGTGTPPASGPERAAEDPEGVRAAIPEKLPEPTMPASIPIAGMPAAVPQPSPDRIDAPASVAPPILPARSAPAGPEPAWLIARARVLLASLDIVGARLMLELALETGGGEPAFLLAETFDPAVLASWRARGVRGDVVRARDLYARAQGDGIAQARERAERLR